MRFELEQDNRGMPDDALLEDLRAVARRLRLSSVSRDEYEREGRFHPKTLVKRFGSWNDSLRRAGLDLRKVHLVTEEEFLNDVRRVAATVGGGTLTVEQYAEVGRYSMKPVARLFGTWKDALSRVGLRPGPGYVRTNSEAELFENLASVWRAVGRQPKQSEMRKPLSIVGHEAYNRRYGSWRMAVECFVADMNQDEGSRESNPLVVDQPPSDIQQPKEEVSPRARIAGWRLRFLVLRRDNFRCCHCGSSPAIRPGTVLVVDHIVPWSRGGATVLENLQTLCETCNGGKGALDDGAV